MPAAVLRAPKGQVGGEGIGYCCRQRDETQGPARCEHPVAEWGVLEQTLEIDPGN